MAASNELRCPIETAVHEAGHCVVAVCVGATVHGVSCLEETLKDEGEICGGARITDFPDLCAEISVNLAGPLAEVRYLAGAKPSSHIPFDESFFLLPTEPKADREVFRVQHDSSSLHEYRKIFERLGSLSDAMDQFQKIVRNTKKLLNQEPVWTAVEVLANELAKRGTLSGKDVVALVKRELRI